MPTSPSSSLPPASPNLYSFPHILSYQPPPFSLINSLPTSSTIDSDHPTPSTITSASSNSRSSSLLTTTTTPSTPQTSLQPSPTYFSPPLCPRLSRRQSPPTTSTSLFSYLLTTFLFRILFPISSIFLPLRFVKTIEDLSRKVLEIGGFWKVDREDEEDWTRSQLASVGEEEALANRETESRALHLDLDSSLGSSLGSGRQSSSSSSVIPFTLDPKRWFGSKQPNSDLAFGLEELSPSDFQPNSDSGIGSISTESGSTSNSHSDFGSSSRDKGKERRAYSYQFRSFFRFGAAGGDSSDGGDGGNRWMGIGIRGIGITRATPFSSPGSTSFSSSSSSLLGLSPLWFGFRRVVGGMRENSVVGDSLLPPFITSVFRRFLPSQSQSQSQPQPTTPLISNSPPLSPDSNHLNNPDLTSAATSSIDDMGQQPSSPLKADDGDEETRGMELLPPGGYRTSSEGEMGGEEDEVRRAGEKWSEGDKGNVGGEEVPDPAMGLVQERDPGDTGKVGGEGEDNLREEVGRTSGAGVKISVEGDGVESLEREEEKTRGTQQVEASESSVPPSSSSPSLFPAVPSSPVLIEPSPPSSPVASPLNFLSSPEEIGGSSTHQSDDQFDGFLRNAVIEVDDSLKTPPLGIFPGSGESVGSEEAASPVEIKSGKLGSKNFEAKDRNEDSYFESGRTTDTAISDYSHKLGGNGRHLRKQSRHHRNESVSITSGMLKMTRSSSLPNSMTVPMTTNSNSTSTGIASYRFPSPTSPRDQLFPSSVSSSSSSSSPAGPSRILGGRNRGFSASTVLTGSPFYSTPLAPSPLSISSTPSSSDFPSDSSRRSLPASPSSALAPSTFGSSSLGSNSWAGAGGLGIPIKGAGSRPPSPRAHGHRASLGAAGRHRRNLSVSPVGSPIFSANNPGEVEGPSDVISLDLGTGLSASSALPPPFGVRKSSLGSTSVGSVEEEDESGFDGDAEPEKDKDNEKPESPELDDGASRFTFPSFSFPPKKGSSVPISPGLILPQGDGGNDDAEGPIASGSGSWGKGTGELSRNFKLGSGSDSPRSLIRPDNPRRTRFQSSPGLRPIDNDLAPELTSPQGSSTRQRRASHHSNGSMHQRSDSLHGNVMKPEGLLRRHSHYLSLNEGSGPPRPSSPLSQSLSSLDVPIASGRLSPGPPSPRLGSRRGSGAQSSRPSTPIHLSPNDLIGAKRMEWGGGSSSPISLPTSISLPESLSGATLLSLPPSAGSAEVSPMGAGRVPTPPPPLNFRPRSPGGTLSPNPLSPRYRSPSRRDQEQVSEQSVDHGPGTSSQDEASFTILPSSPVSPHQPGSPSNLSPTDHAQRRSHSRSQSHQISHHGQSSRPSTGRSRRSSSSSSGSSASPHSPLSPTLNLSPNSKPTPSPLNPTHSSVYSPNRTEFPHGDEGGGGHGLNLPNARIRDSLEIYPHSSAFVGTSLSMSVPSPPPLVLAPSVVSDPQIDLNLSVDTSGKVSATASSPDPRASQVSPPLKDGSKSPPSFPLLSPTSLKTKDSLEMLQQSLRPPKHLGSNESFSSGSPLSAELEIDDEEDGNAPASSSALRSEPDSMLDDSSGEVGSPTEKIPTITTNVESHGNEEGQGDDIAADATVTPILAPSPVSPSREPLLDLNDEISFQPSSEVMVPLNSSPPFGPSRSPPPSVHDIPADNEPKVSPIETKTPPFSDDFVMNNGTPTSNKSFSTNREGAPSPEPNPFGLSDQDFNLSLPDQGENDVVSPLASAPEFEDSLLDSNLNLLERIFVFAKSEYMAHRAALASEVGMWLEESVSRQEEVINEDIECIAVADAVEYVLPLIDVLGNDEPPVRLALCNSLDKVMSYFFGRCSLLPETGDGIGTPTQAADFLSSPLEFTKPPITISTFTPLLLMLLADPAEGGRIAAGTRESVVRFMECLSPHCSSTEPPEPSRLKLDTERDLAPGSRKALQEELVQRVVIGLTANANGNGDDARTVDTTATNDGTASTDEDGASTSTSASDLDVDSFKPPVEVSPEKGWTQISLGDDDDGPRADLDHHQLFGNLDFNTANSSPWMPPGLSSGFSAFSSDYQSQPEDESRLFKKTSAMNLISLLAEVHALDPELVANDIMPEIQKMEHESVWSIRRDAMVAVEKLVEYLPLELALTTILPLYEAFSQDPIWHVRKVACSALPAIVKKLPASTKRTMVLEAVDQFDTDPSKYVRDELLEVSAQLIYSFHEDPDGVPESLLRTFKGPLPAPPPSGHSSTSSDRPFPSPFSSPGFTTNGLSRSSTGWGSNQSLLQALGQFDSDETQRAIVCAFNFPAVALTLGKERWRDSLKDMYKDLCRNFDPTVQRTLAASLHEIAKIVGPEQAESDVLPLFSRHFQELGTHSELVMEHLAETINALPSRIACGQLRAIADDWTGRLNSKWRLKEQIALNLPGLVDNGDDEDELRGEVLLRLLLLALKDPVSAVREGGVKAVPHYCDHNNNAAHLRDRVVSALQDFARDSKFRSRTTFLSCCDSLLLHGLSRERFEVDLLPSILDCRLQADNVANVRIALARVVGRTYQSDEIFADPALRPPRLHEAVLYLASDSLEDVRAFIRPLMSQEDLEPIRAPIPAQPVDSSRVPKPVEPPSKKPVGRIRIGDLMSTPAEGSSTLTAPASTGELATVKTSSPPTVQPLDLSAANENEKGLYARRRRKRSNDMVIDLSKAGIGDPMGPAVQAARREAMSPRNPTMEVCREADEASEDAPNSASFSNDLDQETQDEAQHLRPDSQPDGASQSPPLPSTSPKEHEKNKPLSNGHAPLPHSDFFDVLVPNSSSPSTSPARRSPEARRTFLAPNGVSKPTPISPVDLAFPFTDSSPGYGPPSPLSDGMTSHHLSILTFPESSSPNNYGNKLSRAKSSSAIPSLFATKPELEIPLPSIAPTTTGMTSSPTRTIGSPTKSRKMSSSVSTRPPPVPLLTKSVSHDGIGGGGDEIPATTRALGWEWDRVGR